MVFQLVLGEGVSRLEQPRVRQVFQIFFEDRLIGTSLLEKGDPPMGVAEGLFLAGEKFEEFLSEAVSEPGEPEGIRRWVGLSVRHPNGPPIECRDVVLIEVDLGDEVERRVYAVAIAYPLYEELFPDLVRRYHNQFR